MKLSSIIDNLVSASSALSSVVSVSQHNTQQAQRQAAMAVLAHAEAGEIAARLRTIPLPGHQDLRTPENGLVMLRGRVGGDGAPFNLGEATVSRAAVRLASGEVGFGYTLGRDGEKARLIALCDALVQSRDFAATVERDVIAPLREQLMVRRKQQAEQAAATKVDFYTMVRGEG
ncbi:phosphonate C-P lyase system protein PhnG [Bradyrhizobium guangdongense]|uniref:Phosphonate C-P lyase system protein PhnG n=2 Tax=Bradyrhizobium guangdongense TaxID=1325090 RepID=A0ABX6UA43_9BRAD|nr:phosphonate C-P lyase system protein PhnG [Bradyrhizobium guangdongense]QOZ58153.1 phosphonate C-P lyase system protein PhnG [Bradyrhizobium guangdongense]